jgi:hypothetical protein
MPIMIHRKRSETVGNDRRRKEEVRWSNHIHTSYSRFHLPLSREGIDKAADAADASCAVIGPWLDVVDESDGLIG